MGAEFFFGNAQEDGRDHRAVATAEPTPYAREVITSALDSGRIVGVVSNNGSRTVNSYLERHDLSTGVRLVTARTSHNPGLLKPSPHLIEKSTPDLGAKLTASTLVGDSLTDIEAAHSAGTVGIGYANQSGKKERMEQIGRRL